MNARRNKTGFSLIEVNLAIFVVALGMLTLFSLFPAGLRQGEAAHEGTQEALFADHVLSTLRAEAMLLKADEWFNISSFRLKVKADITGSGTEVQHGGSIGSVEYPAGSGLYMRYILSLDDIGNNNNLRSASLWCKSGQYGAMDTGIFKSGASKFYTEYFYSGMP